MCDHVEYPSRMVADNAVTLHKLSAPECSSIHVYPCGDHFHIGHRKSRAGDACKAAVAFTRPHQPGRDRKPRRRRR